MSAPTTWSDSVTAFWVREAGWPEVSPKGTEFLGATIAKRIGPRLCGPVWSPRDMATPAPSAALADDRRAAAREPWQRAEQVRTEVIRAGAHEDLVMLSLARSGQLVPISPEEWLMTSSKSRLRKCEMDPHQPEVSVPEHIHPRDARALRPIFVTLESLRTYLAATPASHDEELSWGRLGDENAKQWVLRAPWHDEANHRRQISGGGANEERLYDALWQMSKEQGFEAKRDTIRQYAIERRANDGGGKS